jgi:hypothetical protein
MRVVNVDRVDYARKTGYPTRHPIGSVLELRKQERVNNDIDLLRLARRLFVLEMADSVHIVIGLNPSRQGYLPELTIDCAAG